jgi:branched-chain amino acid transport system substrate-binding protein
MAFVKAYRDKFKETPRMGSVVGMALIQAIAAGLTKSGGVGLDKTEEGFKGAAFDTPIGHAMFRAIDHQSTLGTYVGKTALKDGKGIMVDWKYIDGASSLPPDAEVKKLRVET